MGSRDNGIVSLDLDPALFQNCGGCGRIFAGFNDGIGEITDIGFAEESPPIAKLDLPAGSYAIFAKLNVITSKLEFETVPSKRSISCLLSAGNDFDRSSALLEESDDLLTIDNDEVVMTLQVVHRFTQPGEAVLRCSKGIDFADDVPVGFSNLKIIALEGSHISNVFLGNN